MNIKYSLKGCSPICAASMYGGMVVKKGNKIVIGEAMNYVKTSYWKKRIVWKYLFHLFHLYKLEGLLQIENLKVICLYLKFLKKLWRK